MSKSKSEFEHKNVKVHEVQEMVGRAFEAGITPIVQEVGKTIRQLVARIEALELTVNTLVTEMQEWKADHTKTIQ